MNGLQTNTEAQSNLATRFGDTAAQGQGTVGAIRDTVAALQPHLVGEAGAATQAKAQQLSEAATALLTQLQTTAEKVGASSVSYAGTDQDGGGLIGASAGQMF